MTISKRDKNFPVAVTGYGMITSLGIGVERNWQSLIRGKSGIKPISRFDSTGLKNDYCCYYRL